MGLGTRFLPRRTKPDSGPNVRLGTIIGGFATGTPNPNSALYELKTGSVALELGPARLAARGQPTLSGSPLRTSTPSPGHLSRTGGSPARAARRGLFTARAPRADLCDRQESAPGQGGGWGSSPARGTRVRLGHHSPRLREVMSEEQRASAWAEETGMGSAIGSRLFDQVGVNLVALTAAAARAASMEPPPPQGSGTGWSDSQRSISGASQWSNASSGIILICPNPGAFPQVPKMVVGVLPPPLSLWSANPAGPCCPRRCHVH